MARRSAGNRQKHENPNPVQRLLVDRFHGETIRLLRSVAPITILDIGCGEGYVLEALDRAGFTASLTGLDLAEEAVAAARDRLGSRAEILLGDVHELWPKLGRFDVVLMLEVLEHLDEPDRALEVIAALTHSRAIVSVPREPAFRGLNLLRMKNVSRWGSDPEHVQHWTRRSFEAFVSERFHILGRGSAFPWTLLLLAPRDRDPASK